MISKEQYREMHALHELGVPIKRIAEKYHLERNTVSRWLRRTEEEYDLMQRDKLTELEQYRGFIVDLLKTCPQIRETNIYFRLQEAFPDFDFKKSVFYKYMHRLREQTGYAQFPKREAGVREKTPPGYEAQVDFGQFKMRDMYGATVRVYFFCMVLSYSRMHFVYFSRTPFTTATAIEALNSAALEWLDIDANAKVNAYTRKTPHELFREERHHLIRVQIHVERDAILTVNVRNCVLYKTVYYEMPRAWAKPGDTLRGESADGMVLFYRTDDGRLIYKCAESTDGEIVRCTERRDQGETVSMATLRLTFSQYDCYPLFMEGFAKVQPRYRNPQCVRICQMARLYSEGKTAEAMAYCVRVDKCDGAELVAYLIARYGEDKAKRVLNPASFYHAKQRALEIVREQGWQI